MTSSLCHLVFLGSKLQSMLRGADRPALCIDSDWQLRRVQPPTNQPSLIWSSPPLRRPQFWLRVVSSHRTSSIRAPALLFQFRLHAACAEPRNRLPPLFLKPFVATSPTAKALIRVVGDHWPLAVLTFHRRAASCHFWIASSRQRCRFLFWLRQGLRCPSSKVWARPKRKPRHTA
jgi:hypothetical protein